MKKSRRKFTDAFKAKVAIERYCSRCVDGKNDMVLKDIWIGDVNFYNYIKEKGYQEL